MNEGSRSAARVAAPTTWLGGRKDSDGQVDGGRIALRQPGWLVRAVHQVGREAYRGAAALAGGQGVIRTIVEVTVLAAGWLLGGSVGVGTVLYAVLIGPIMHRTIPLFAPGDKRPKQASAPLQPCRGSGQ